MNPEQYGIHAAVDVGHWWWRARREILREAIARHAPPRDRLELAEVGCGTGGNLAMLARFGRVLGAEPSAAALEHARARVAGERIRLVRHAVPEPLPDRFDVIGLFDVLEHLPDDLGAVAWVARQLTPGGIALFTVPAFDFLWTEQDDAVQHLRRYTPARLERLVPPELEVVHLTCFNAFLFLPILAARTAMRLLRRGGPPRSHLGKPPRAINEVLFSLMRSERHLVLRSRVPLGVSVLLVARRRGSAAITLGDRPAPDRRSTGTSPA